MEHYREPRGDLSESHLHEVFRLLQRRGQRHDQERVELFRADPENQSYSVRDLDANEAQTLSVPNQGWSISISTMSSPNGLIVQGMLLGLSDEDMAVALVVLLRDRRFVCEAQVDATGVFQFELSVLGKHTVWIDMLDKRILVGELNFPLANER